MKIIIVFLSAFFCSTSLLAQNVGIGNNTPAFPLSFANSIGDKISLFGNTPNHYGFGIQNNLLQIHADGIGSNIAMGYGSSNSFTERMRILNNGSYDGMILNGRLILKNGSTDLVGGGAGIWLYKADNSGQLGFMGTQNNQNIGFYGGSGGWGFTYNAINSRVGIGNTNPNAPLAFAATLEKKITLYPGATGDVGFGVAPNRLQIYADNPNADVAIGYDAAGVFKERFAVKPNGALALNGSVGGSGQVLKSNGAGAAASWVGKPYVLSFSQTGNSAVFLQGNLSTTIPGLDNQTLSITETSNVVFNASITVFDPNVLYTSYVYTEVQFLNSSAQVIGKARAYGNAAPLRKTNLNITGTVTLSPGFYTTRVVLGKDTEPDANPLTRSEGEGKLILEIFPN